MFAKSSLVWPAILYIYSNKDISSKIFKKKAKISKIGQITSKSNDKKILKIF